jgi:aldose 1-epimerase
MAVSGELLEIANGPYRAVVCEIGAALAGLWCADRALTTPWPADAVAPMWSGAVLLPWPNRIRDGRYTSAGVDYQLPLNEPAQANALHGLARWTGWAVVQHGPSAVTLTDRLVPQPGYPFELDLRIEYSLGGDTGLSVRTEVTNIGTRSAPFGAGSHAYLDLGPNLAADARVQVPAAVRIVQDQQQIPIGRAEVSGTRYDFRTARRLGNVPLDDAFTELGADQAWLEIAGRRTTVWWDSQFGYLQVFVAPVDEFGANAIAIEPMTCPGDAFNSGEGLLLLGPGDSWAGTWGILDGQRPSRY